jgi:hypothetical protein
VSNAEAGWGKGKAYIVTIILGHVQMRSRASLLSILLRDKKSLGLKNIAVFVEGALNHHIVHQDDEYTTAHFLIKTGPRLVFKCPRIHQGINFRMFGQHFLLSTFVI